MVAELSGEVFPAECSALVRELRQEVAELRQEVDHLRRENLELR